MNKSATPGDKDKSGLFKQGWVFLLILVWAGVIGGFFWGSVITFADAQLTGSGFDVFVFHFWISIAGLIGTLLGVVCVLLSGVFLRHFSFWSSVLYGLSGSLLVALIHMFYFMEATPDVWYAGILGYWLGIALLYFRHLCKLKRACLS